MFGNKKPGRKLKRPNTMLIIESTKKRIFRYVPNKFIPKDSFEKEYHGIWLHILGLNMKGELWPIQTLKAEEGRMPTDLYMAKNCADEVEEYYGLSMPTLEKVKIGVLIALIVGILIVLFMMASQGMGA